MAKQDRTIIGKLNAKATQLVTASQTAKERAEYHRSQIVVAEDAAALGAKQAVAVTEALKVLENAGVSI